MKAEGPIPVHQFKDILVTNSFCYRLPVLLPELRPEVPS